MKVKRQKNTCKQEPHQSQDRRVNLRQRDVKRHSKGRDTLIITFRSIPQKETTIRNEPACKSSKTQRAKSADLQGETDSSPVTVEDSNIPPSVTEKTRHKKSADTDNQNDTITNLTQLTSVEHPTQQHTVFSNTRGESSGWTTFQAKRQTSIHLKWM